MSGRRTMRHPDPEALLAPVIEIVRRAAAAVLAIYEVDRVQSTLKADASPLTLADLTSHRLIVDALKALTPDIPVLSEESADVPFEERGRWHAFWLVDPLDGTKEFLARNGEFTINVALVSQHEPVLGVVGVPARGVVYSGIPGVCASRLDDDGVVRPIATCRPPPARLRVVGSRSHRGASLDALLTHLGPHELVAVGSALKFCIVAEGAADLYPRLGPTSEWDTAAADAVLVAAGGGIITLDGTRLSYNAKPDLLNPSFLAFGDPSRDWRASLR